jgi:hypothetical protein
VQPLYRIFKGETLKGEQPAILDRDLFDAVQDKLDRQAQNQTSRQSRSEALLMGRIFDDAGNRMTPTHTCKRDVKYRYYLSSALLNGEAEQTGSVSRVPAVALEAVVIRSVRQHRARGTGGKRTGWAREHAQRPLAKNSSDAPPRNSPARRSLSTKRPPDTLRKSHDFACLHCPRPPLA